MGMEIATAWVGVRGDTSLIQGDIERGRPAIESAAEGLATRINGILSKIGVGFALYKIYDALAGSLPMAERQIDADQRLEATIRATGEAAGWTADQLKQMAVEMQAATTIEDDVYEESMAKLLTFKAVKGEEFQRTMKVAADLAAAGFGDVRSSVVMLGRSLENPMMGMTRLRRVGVSITEEEKAQVKELMEQGRLREAQHVILKAVEGQVKGIAEAMAQTDVGQLKQAQNTLGDVREELGKAWIPVQTAIVRVQTEFYRLMQIVGQAVATIVAPFAFINDLFGGLAGRVVLVAAAVISVALAIKRYGDAIQRTWDVLVAFTKFAATNPFMLWIMGITAVIGLVQQLWDEISTPPELQAPEMAEEGGGRGPQPWIEGNTRIGFAEFGQKIQDAFLKRGMEGDGLTKLVGLTESSNEIQGEMRDILKRDEGKGGLL